MGYVVKEILKIKTMMYKAIESDEKMADEEDMGSISMTNFIMISKLYNLKAPRQLSNYIIKSGIKSFNFLS